MSPLESLVIVGLLAWVKVALAALLLLGSGVLVWLVWGLVEGEDL